MSQLFCTFLHPSGYKERHIPCSMYTISAEMNYYILIKMKLSCCSIASNCEAGLYEHPLREYIRWWQCGMVLPSFCCLHRQLRSSVRLPWSLLLKETKASVIYACWISSVVWHLALDPELRLLRWCHKAILMTRKSCNEQRASNPREDTSIAILMLHLILDSRPRTVMKIS